MLVAGAAEQGVHGVAHLVEEVVRLLHAQLAPLEERRRRRAARLVLDRGRGDGQREHHHRRLLLAAGQLKVKKL